jgi:hypothetical protein
MTFLAPGFFLASLAVAAATVALHFIVTRQPRAAVLPTARFVPDLPATATAPARRPSDLLLLLVRVLLVLAVGTGLAKPVFKPSRSAEARVILADVSRSVTDSIALRDSVRAWHRPHDALVLFDSSTRAVDGDAAELARALSPSARRGNISAGLIAAIRATAELRDRADSIELVIVSPFAAEELDAATDSVRRLWPGRARVVRIAAPSPEVARGTALELTADAGDPMQASASIARVTSNANAALVRVDISASNVRADTDGGRALVKWPATARPPRALQRTARDTIGGVLTDSTLVVATFERQWKFAADSLQDVEVVARWIDGEPAAIEWPSGAGCIRSVAVPVVSAGDLVIRDDFIRFVSALSSDCAFRRATRSAARQSLNTLEGTGGLAPRQAFPARRDVPSTLAPWLLGLALAAAVGELFIRRHRDGFIGAVSPEVRRERAA